MAFRLVTLLGLLMHLILHGCTHFSYGDKKAKSMISFDLSTTTEMAIGNVGQFQITVSNRSRNAIAIIRELRLGSNGEASHAYNLFISHEAASYFFGEGVFNKPRVHSESEYEIIAPGDSLTRKFEVDFSRLSSDPLNFNTMNLDFGKYTFHLEYADAVSSHGLALKGKFSTDSVTVLYGTP